MASAIPIPIRREIVARHQKGEPLRAIAKELGYSFWGVRKIWRAYRDEGEPGLSIGYSRSGRSGVRSERLIYRAAVWLKRHHPGWGVGVIRVLLQARYPDQPLPHKRTFERWFRAQQLSIPPTVAPQPQQRERAQVVHQTWQLDATSHQQLADGSPASWLSLVDEYSGALLESRAFPPVHL